jgi:nucleoside-diphosphate-sugar epimerase
MPMITRARLRAAYAGRNILITGGASFLGSHLCELLVEAGARVTVADDLSSGRLENLDSVRGQIQFRPGDLREPAFTREVVNGQAIVFHLAADHGGRGYIETHPVECTGNAVLDHIVFAAAGAAGVKKIVFASSACVYPTNLQASESDRRLLRESDASYDEPGTAFADGEYGWAKFYGELQLRAVHRQYGTDGVACRIFTTYGERENETHAVIALIAKAALRLDPYPIWGNGLQTRNFTYVGDTVTGLALAGARLGGFACINVGTSEHHTIVDLLEEIFHVAHWRPKSIDRQLDKPIGVKSRASDLTRCREWLGWEPQYSLREGVERTMRWYLESCAARNGRDLNDALMERQRGLR